MITIFYQNGEFERFRNCESWAIQSISFSGAVPVLSFESILARISHVPFSAPPSVSPSGAELSKEGDTTAPSHLATPAPGADNTGGGSFDYYRESMRQRAEAWDIVIKKMNEHNPLLLCSLNTGLDSVLLEIDRLYKAK